MITLMFFAKYDYIISDHAEVPFVLIWNTGPLINSDITDLKFHELNVTVRFTRSRNECNFRANNIELNYSNKF